MARKFVSILQYGLLLMFCLGMDTASPQLLIEIHGIQARAGQLKLAVYQGEENWMHAEQALLKTALTHDGQSQKSIRISLPLGEYAISVMHDENDNNRMDMSWFPYPHPGEGVGVSNDAEGNMGPPSYNDARFQFRSDGQVITILMHYYD